VICSTFQDKRLPLLGFGTMRLPLDGQGAIDEGQVARMVDYALANGVNYFDTAWPYHNGQSEPVIGRVLSRYDRDSYYLATKYPGHQISDRYDPAATFEAQLKKCGVEYFDFYLLHNVYEKSMETYLNPELGILDYFKEQKRLGRIRHLGFSCHARPEALETFLDACGADMEFCQIQLNYLDWTLQNAKRAYELLTERGIPVWVMEPVRGGKLAQLTPEDEGRLQQLRPEESAAAWAFRFLQGLPNVTMILSGMSDMEQLQDNIKTFSQRRDLSPQETALLFDIAEGMKNAVPCTACRYCCDGCPAGLDIPRLLALYNDLRFAPSLTIGMRIQSIPASGQPSACIGCGQCTAICPQKIDIPAALRDFAQQVSKLPLWEDVCRQRAQAEQQAAARV